MTKKEIQERIETILESTRRGWISYHKNETEALRWWLAYVNAEEAVDSYNMREWTEVFLDGIPPAPSTVSEIIDEIQERSEDDEEVEGWLQSLEEFYTEK